MLAILNGICIYILVFFFVSASSEKLGAFFLISGIVITLLTTLYFVGCLVAFFLNLI